MHSAKILKLFHSSVETKKFWKTQPTAPLSWWLSHNFEFPFPDTPGIKPKILPSALTFLKCFEIMLSPYFKKDCAYPGLPSNSPSIH